MPIKSYLAYSVTGRRDALARALAALGGCEVIPASNRDVLVLVTDTPDDDAIDKGIGTIIPGFVPEPWGKIPRYSPTLVELHGDRGALGPRGLRVHGAGQGRHRGRARPVAVAQARGVSRMTHVPRSASG